MRVVLIEPEIPQNTGSVARLCAGTGIPLHLVGRLGFSLEDRYLKRAGLDYWPAVTLHHHATVEEWLAHLNDEPVWALSSHATRDYTEVRYGPRDWLVFGCESVGLPSGLRQRFAGGLLQIPSNGMVRSYNLSNSVAVVMFEAGRQQRFPWRGAP